MGGAGRAVRGDPWASKRGLVPKWSGARSVLARTIFQLTIPPPVPRSRCWHCHTFVDSSFEIAEALGDCPSGQGPVSFLSIGQLTPSVLDGPVMEAASREKAAVPEGRRV